MGQISKQEKQQKLQNILLAGNLYKSHKIHKDMVKFQNQSSQLQSQSLGAIEKLGEGIDSVNEKLDIQNSILENEHREKKLKEEKLKSINHILFIVSEEIEEIEYKINLNKKKENLEIYFRILSISAELDQNNINPENFDTVAEKKEISNLLKRINKSLLLIKNKLTKTELTDLDKITDILEFNEELELEKLNSSALAIAEKTKKNKINYLKESLKGRCGDVLYFFPIGYNLFDFKELRNNPHYKIKMPLYIFKELESLWPKNTSSQVVNVWYLQFQRNLVSQFSNSEIIKIQFLWYAWSKKYSRGAKWANTGIVGGFKSLLGKKKTDQDVWDDFKNKNIKIFNKIEKLLPKLIENSYLHIKQDREKELKKIDQLKMKIENEKKEANDLYKKYPFVKTILKSRIMD